MRIAENQCPAAPRSHFHPVAGTAARFNPYEVVPQALKLVFNTAGASISNRNHTNERAYADRYPQDGKHTANPVAIQGSECFAENGLETHKSIRLSVQFRRAKFYYRFGRIVCSPRPFGVLEGHGQQ